MPARRTRRKSPAETLQEDFAAHIEAHDRAYAWVAKAIRYRKEGHPEKAIEAQERAKFWLRRVEEIEGRYSRHVRSHTQH